jgi:ABC-2 type transport system ATP-binding protein
MTKEPTGTRSIPGGVGVGVEVEVEVAVAVAVAVEVEPPVGLPHATTTTHASVRMRAEAILSCAVSSQGTKRALITVSHLTKRYGAHLAVDDVSFDVARGDVLGFLGPNGAGKSTTLRILAGFLGPTSGKVTIAGHDVVTSSFDARRCIGYMPESVPLYPEMRVVEYLRFRAELKRVPRSHRGDHVDGAMRKAGVVDVAHKRIGHLSKGYRQRVALADALVARPPIVILDEPTAGLDPNQIRETRALVRELGRDHTVVLSTHILSEVEACATRVLLIHHGKLVAEGPTADIRSMRGSSSVEIAVGGEGSAAKKILESVDGISHVALVEGSGATTRVRASFAKELGAGDRAGATERSVALLVAAGIGVREVRPDGGSLEDVFASLTKEAAGDEVVSS